MSQRPKYMTAARAAEECSVSTDTIHRAVKSGRLAAKRTGKSGRSGLVLISEKALDAWFESLHDADST